MPNDDVLTDAQLNVLFELAKKHVAVEVFRRNARALLAVHPGQPEPRGAFDGIESLDAGLGSDQEDGESLVSFEKFREIWRKHAIPVQRCWNNAHQNFYRDVCELFEKSESSTPRIEQLRKALFESRDAMRIMSNWVKKSDPAGHSWAVHMVDYANAALNGEPQPRAEVTDWNTPCTGCATPRACQYDGCRKEPRAEVTGWQPIETAPPDTEVVVFWLDPESPEHPERYDFDMLDDGCWRQWTDHYEWAHSVAPADSRLPREQAPYTHWKPLGSPAPIAAARTGASS